jgi:hypothetical protein
MPKFRVTVTVHLDYLIDVEAKDSNEARENVMDDIESNGTSGYPVCRYSDVTGVERM